MSKHFWNYRIMQKKHQGGESQYAIHEVHYEDGKVYGWAENPSDVYTYIMEGEEDDPILNLAKVVEMMKTALDKPILDFETGEEI